MSEFYSEVEAPKSNTPGLDAIQIKINKLQKLLSDRKNDLPAWKKSVRDELQSLNWLTDILLDNEMSLGMRGYYFSAVHRGLRDIYGLTINVDKSTEDFPVFDNVPDGNYPMVINGRLDKIKVKDNELACRISELD